MPHTSRQGPIGLTQPVLPEQLFYYHLGIRLYSARVSKCIPEVRPCHVTAPTSNHKKLRISSLCALSPKGTSKNLGTIDRNAPSIKFVALKLSQVSYSSKSHSIESPQENCTQPSTLRGSHGAKKVPLVRIQLSTWRSKAPPKLLVLVHIDYAASLQRLSTRLFYTPSSRLLNSSYVAHHWDSALVINYASTLQAGKELFATRLISI